MERTEIIAALGPTNTGKTHRALARMQEHESGIIGLPLRLLAREVYDKLVGKLGSASVALITGEEKLIPKRPRYYVCTVEAMPTELEVDFVAVDEIQLAGHFERGHVFTDRLLHARGRKETWFMGSDTMLPLIEELVPTAHHRKFPRFSSLKGFGSASVGTLPKRSAVVAFSAARVYELAERIRARKGGAALVLGALSPRARNAQVEMYQAGEVDYLVATDAIGMGLNLDIDCVAFADTRKFDGRETRELDLSELAQIAGRAGRHQRDGTFGTFEPRGPLPPPLVRAIEEHRFPAQRRLIWRNSDLDFSSPKNLLESLAVTPKKHCLSLVDDAEDTRTLSKLIARPHIMDQITSEERLRLLWEVCQVPDYRKLMLDEHANLTGEIFCELVEQGRIRKSWLEPRLERLAQPPPDIETIMGRLAFVRTWTYVACHEAWMEPQSGLRQRTRELEDELSDALHAALVERFVERKKKHSFAQARSSRKSHTSAQSGFAGQLAAMMNQLDEEKLEAELAFFQAACTAPSDELQVSLSGVISFRGEEVGRLRKGRTLLEPDVSIAQSFDNTGFERELLERLRRFAKEFVAQGLGPLAHLEKQEWSSAARGLLYQLRQGLGSARTHDLKQQIDALPKDERARLENQGLVLGQRQSFLRASLKAKTISIRSTLVRTHLFAGVEAEFRDGALGDSPLANSAQGGRPAFPLPPSSDKSIWPLIGYVPLGSHAIRVDVIERILKDAPDTEDHPALVATRAGIKKRSAKAIAKRLRL